MTEAGLELTNRVAREHFANELHMLSGLAKSERTQLADLLAKLERSLLDSRARVTGGPTGPVRPDHAPGTSR